jgi:hypothetical protein
MKKIKKPPLVATAESDMLVSNVHEQQRNLKINQQPKIKYTSVKMYRSNAV